MGVHQQYAAFLQAGPAAPNAIRSSPLLGTRLFLAGMLFLVAGTSRAQSVRADSASKAPSNRNGSWSAAAASGQTFMGTWTAVLDTSGTVTGTWELTDAQNRTLAQGGWSAAKAPDTWIGGWRAVVTGKDGEYSGTWTAAVGDSTSTQFANLFANALQAVVSGTWRMDQLSGAWSIRTFK
jgi:hypothetical protein